MVEGSSPDSRTRTIRLMALRNALADASTTSVDRPATRHGHAVDLEAQRDVGEGVDATGHRGDGVVGESTFDAGHWRMALHAASTMPSPCAVVSSFSPFVLQHDRGGRRAVGAAVTVDRHQLERVANGVAHLFGDEGLEIGLGQLHFAVGQFLEPGERLVQARRRAGRSPSSSACRRRRGGRSACPARSGCRLGRRPRDP